MQHDHMPALLGDSLAENPCSRGIQSRVDRTVAPDTPGRKSVYTESMILNQAIDSFLKDASVGSAYTRRTYRSALNRFRAYAQEQGIEPEEAEVTVLNVDLLLNFATWLLNEQYAHKRTMQTYLSGIMSFVRFLFVRDLWQISPKDMSRLTEGIQRLRRNQKPPALVPHPPPLGEIQKLAEVARAVKVDAGDDRGELIKWRNISIMETLLSTGLRVGELVKVLRKDLDSLEHSLWIRGKRGVERKVFFSAEAWDTTQQYLTLREPWISPAPDQSGIFISIVAMTRERGPACGD